MLSSNARQKDIAKALNVSERTVARIAKQVRPDLEQADKLLHDLQLSVAKHLPTEKTVKSMARLLSVAEKTKQPSAGLGIIQYRDKIMGLVTPLDRLKVESAMHAALVGHSQGVALRPIFQLESGASINITVGHAPQPAGGDVIDAPSTEVQPSLDPLQDDSSSSIDQATPTPPNDHDPE